MSFDNEASNRDNDAVLDRPMRCGAGDRCHYPGGAEHLLEEQYDRYSIYAGQWHEPCWNDYGYGDFEFDASYAGESLDEEW